jgi:hypothetical protein
VIGAILASLACSVLAKRITVAKLYYFDSDRDGLFRRMGASTHLQPERASILDKETKSEQFHKQQL